MLDWSELSVDGRELEQLTREVLLLEGFSPRWSGVGPDGGRDLLFVEQGGALLGRKERRWLVSCKHHGAGTAVGVAEVTDVVASCAHHGADGFLLACTTHPSAAAVARLEGIEQDRANRLVTHVWDGVTLERLLASPRGWAVAQRFMPVSTEASGWRIFGTENPNRWVAVRAGHYFHLSNRVGSTPDFPLQSVAARMDKLTALPLPDGHQFRMRGVWLDDAHGGFVWFVDYMLPNGENPIDLKVVRDQMWDGRAWEDGQFYDFDIQVHRYRGVSDHFDIDHYDYYGRLPGYV